MERDQTTNVTEALRRFEAEWHELFGLVTFVGHLITRADEVALTAARALVESASDEEERKRLEETIERGGAGVRSTMQERYAGLFTRLVFQRLVDNFLSYIAELLRVIFATRPEALRSSETVRLEEVLQYETMDELVRFLVERRVERLTYLSVEDLAKDIDRLLGLELFNGPDELAKAVELVAIRNVIAHNRGIVNSRFLLLVPGYPTPEGEEVGVGADEFFEAAEFLAAVASRIDARAVPHFTLESEPRSSSVT